MSPEADKPQGSKAQDLAQNMLLGQHGTFYTSAVSGMPLARVEELARKLHATKRIPRVRA